VEWLFLLLIWILSSLILLPPLFLVPGRCPGRCPAHLLVSRIGCAGQSSPGFSPARQAIRMIVPWRYIVGACFLLLPSLVPVELRAPVNQSMSGCFSRSRAELSQSILQLWFSSHPPPVVYFYHSQFLILFSFRVQCAFRPCSQLVFHARAQLRSSLRFHLYRYARSSMLVVIL
jgi:hypothetical protein